MPKPSPLARILCIACTSLGVGLLPGARGTYGSALTLAAALVWLGLGGPALAGWGYGLFLAALFAAAVGLSQAALAAQVFGPGCDPGQIVIDEALGMLIACYGLAAPIVWWQAGLAFAGFRFFDITKPWPVGASQGLPGGWGVVVDDVLAGLYALGVVWLARALVGG